LKNESKFSLMTIINKINNPNIFNIKAK